MNRLREALAGDAAAFGAWCTGPATNSAEAMAATGIDWIVIDAQHGAVDDASLPGLVQAVELGGSVPVVRVGWNEPRAIMRALDLGAAAVIVPMVEDAAQARAAASACRYPPDGVRSFGPIRPRSHASRNDPTPLCLVMIETVDGLDAVDDIVAVPGVDGVFVGAVDLGLSMGLGVTGRDQPAALVAAVDRVVAACRAAGLVAAGMARSGDDAAGYVRRGFRLVTIADDRGLVHAGLTRELAAVTSGRTS